MCQRWRLETTFLNMGECGRCLECFRDLQKALAELRVFTGNAPHVCVPDDKTMVSRW